MRAPTAVRGRGPNKREQRQARRASRLKRGEKKTAQAVSPFCGLTTERKTERQLPEANGKHRRGARAGASPDSRAQPRQRRSPGCAPRKPARRAMAATAAAAAGRRLMPEYRQAAQPRRHPATAATSPAVGTSTLLTDPPEEEPLTCRRGPTRRPVLLPTSALGPTWRMSRCESWKDCGLHKTSIIRVGSPPHTTTCHHTIRWVRIKFLTQEASDPQPPRSRRRGRARRGSEL
jgi:hypothetical protein